MDTKERLSVVLIRYDFAFSFAVLSGLFICGCQWWKSEQENSTAYQGIDTKKQVF